MPHPDNCESARLQQARMQMMQIWKFTSLGTKSIVGISGAERDAVGPAECIC